MAARGGKVERVGEERRESGHPSAAVHRPPALIREFNCQPYESEPIIDSTRTCVCLSLSLSIERNRRAVCTCCACTRPAAALCNSRPRLHSSGYPLLRLSSRSSLSNLEIKTYRGVLKLMHLFLLYTHTYYIALCVILDVIGRLIYL